MTWLKGYALCVVTAQTAQSEKHGVCAYSRVGCLLLTVMYWLLYKRTKWIGRSQERGARAGFSKHPYYQIG